LLLYKQVRLKLTTLLHLFLRELERIFRHIEGIELFCNLQLQAMTLESATITAKTQRDWHRARIVFARYVFQPADVGLTRDGRADVFRIDDREIPPWSWVC
jgi:hypothetical protein